MPIPQDPWCVRGDNSKYCSTNKRIQHTFYFLIYRGAAFSSIVKILDHDGHSRGYNGMSFQNSEFTKGKLTTGEHEFHLFSNSNQKEFSHWYGKHQAVVGTNEGESD